LANRFRCLGQSNIIEHSTKSSIMVEAALNFAEPFRKSNLASQLEIAIVSAKIDFQRSPLQSFKFLIESRSQNVFIRKPLSLENIVQRSSKVIVRPISHCWKKVETAVMGQRQSGCFVGQTNH